MAIDTSQLPEGVQKSVGNTKQPVGVITDGLPTEDDVLAYQAARVARNTPGASVYTGRGFDPEVIERVAGSTHPGDRVGMTQETITALQQGGIQRDQAFVGNNANFTGYYLEPNAKYVIPQRTPFRNMVPRLPGAGIDTINWRAITDYFGGTGPTVGAFILQQQGTPNKLSYVWVNQSNIYKMLAVEDIVTFESEIYGKMFQGDVRATIAAKLMPALMQGEEVCLIDGAQKLWAPPPPAGATTATTGGTIAAATNWIIVTAVNANGETLAAGTVAATPQAASIPTTGATSTVTFNIFTVPNAVSYRVYVGTGATQPANSAMWLQGAAAQFGSASALNQPTTGKKQGYFTVTATAAWATAGTAYSTVVTAGNTAIAFKSTDTNTLNMPLMFDGAQSLLYLNQGAASTIGVAGETPLIAQPAAANGALVLADVDTLLENMNLSSAADPDFIATSIKDHKKLSYLVAQGTNFRVTIPNQGPGLDTLVGGQRVTKYINQTTGKMIDIIMLPYLTQGTMIIGSMSIPFPVSAIEKPPFRIEVNREMWAVEYPPDQSHNTQWMYAAFENATVINQYLGGWALLNGITLL